MGAPDFVVCVPGHVVEFALNGGGKASSGYWFWVWMALR